MQEKQLSEIAKQQDKERQDCIDLLLSLGCEDLTEKMHPNKIEKKWLRYKFNKTYWIDFNFDYIPYPDFYFKPNRKHISGAKILFSELRPLLKKLKII